MLRSIVRSPWTFPNDTLALLRRLLVEEGTRRWRSYALSFVLAAVAAGCTALTAYLIGTVINTVYIEKNFAALAVLCAATVVLFTVKGLSLFGQTVVLARTSNDIIAEMHKRMFDKLLCKNLGHFADRHSSEVMMRVSFGAANVAGVLNMLINAVGRDAATLVGLASVMVIQSPLLSLVGLIIMPPSIWFVRRVLQQIRSLAIEQYSRGTATQQTLQETLQGFRIIKAFTLEEVMRRRIYESVDAGHRAGNMMALLANRTSPLMDSLGGVAIALVLFYGGYRVIAGGETPGVFLSFITAFLLAYEPAKRLARINIGLSQSLTGVRMLYEFLDSPPDEPELDEHPPLRVSAGSITFTDVEFGYRPDEPVIRGISFVAEPGKMTALVGPSGGGKSTLLSLLLRLYDAQRGAITIDGQDIARASRRSVRRQLAYVGQDVYLFRGSIGENIALGKPGATADEVAAAARAARVDDFTMGFPAGYDTPVGELGGQLSAGQRQRVAIARALIKDAPIILLDEPTASLDSESEHDVQDAIAHLCRGRTTVIVAHRLHTITHADRIHVIEDGRIVESGRHDDLLRRDGRYASLYRLLVKEERSLPRLLESKASAL
jgi:ATP-binding cassette, subfamily B, bacterial MsbA